MERDQDEDAPYGQRSRKTFELADVFIQLKSDEYKQQLERFLDLLFGHPYLTPEPDEHAMFLAYSAGLRSGQLARQVGAAIRSAGETSLRWVAMTCQPLGVVCTGPDPQMREIT